MFAGPIERHLISSSQEGSSLTLAGAFGAAARSPRGRGVGTKSLAGRSGFFSGLFSAGGLLSSDVLLGAWGALRAARSVESCSRSFSIASSRFSVGATGSTIGAWVAGGSVAG